MQALQKPADHYLKCTAARRVQKHCQQSASTEVKQKGGKFTSSKKNTPDEGSEECMQISKVKRQKT